VVDPAGRIMGFGGALRPAAPREPGHFSIYDIDAKTLTVRRVDDPKPDPVREGRPFCYLPDRDQVFYLEEARAKDPSKAEMRTWVYNVSTNKFEQLGPKHSPVQGEVTVAEYLQDEKAVYAVIRASSNREHEEWIYSFDRNDWARLATTGVKSHFTQPYGQLAYVADYRVLVSVRGTYVLRPDVDAAKWD
jgi:hypothetical protein